MATQYFKDKGHPKPIGGPVRRRRVLIFCALLLALFFFFFVPWELPSSLKDAGLSGLSRANVAQLTKSKNVVKVGEIYGLLHLVTGDHEQEHVLGNALQLDPTIPVELSVYAAGDNVDWVQEKALIDKEYPVVVFSKTYCPYSKRAKDLLAAYDIQPPPKIVEVDIRDDGNVIKHLLTRLTKHSTFPNILLRGHSIGGSDDLKQLHENKTLTKLLEEAGATHKASGPK